MPYFIYSPEALPNPEMMGRPRYTPDADYIRWGGVALSPIPKGEWVRLPESLSTVRHADWRDRQGTEVEIAIRRYKAVVDNPDRGFAARGVVMLDHEPSAGEKAALERKSAELNLRFRKQAVEFYESQRKAAEARQGTYEPSPYVDECYELLQMKKPYSMEALRAQRDPGREAAREMAEAIRDVMRDERQRAADAVARAVTVPPKQEPTPAGR